MVGKVAFIILCSTDPSLTNVTNDKLENELQQALTSNISPRILDCWEIERIVVLEQSEERVCED